MAQGLFSPPDPRYEDVSFESGMSRPRIMSGSSSGYSRERASSHGFPMPMRDLHVPSTGIPQRARGRTSSAFSACSGEQLFNAPQGEQFFGVHQQHQPHQPILLPIREMGFIDIGGAIEPIPVCLTWPETVRATCNDIASSWRAMAVAVISLSVIAITIVIAKLWLWHHSAVLAENGSSANGVWHSFGVNRACRLNKNDKSINGHGVAMYIGYPVESIQTCQVLCAQRGNCHGIEYHSRGRRCELWTQPIEHSVTVFGYACYEYLPVDRGSLLVPAPAEVWMTTVHPDASPDTILQTHPTIRFHPGATMNLDQSVLPEFDEGGPVDYRQDDELDIQDEHEDCKKVHGVYREDCHILPEYNVDNRRWAPRKVKVLVDTADALQTITGFGAAMTQASAEVLYSLKRRREDLYDVVMRRLFGTEEGCAGITFVRVPIGSSDFASYAETFDDSSDDWTLSKFKAPEHDLTIHILSDAKIYNPELQLMGTPWSPPAWLKTLGTFAGKSPNNTLIDSHRAYLTYATYLAKVVSFFKFQGLPMSYLTLQNEPLWGYGPHPGMYLSAASYSRLAKEVKKLVGDSVKILTYDHNWDHPEFPIESIEAAPGVFQGTAWHCYGGRMDRAQDMVHQKWPFLETHVTECTGSYPNDKCDIEKGLHHFGYHHEWDMRHIFVGATGHWAKSSIKWIMVADENCGPRLPGTRFKSGRPLISIPSGADNIDQIKFNQDFWSVAHMARFIRPGAQRVMSVKKGSSASIIEAFNDDSANTVTVIAINEDHSFELPLEVSSFGAHFNLIIPKWGTVILRWHKPRPS